MPKQPLPTPAAFCDKPYVHIPLTPVVSSVATDGGTKNG